MFIDLETNKEEIPEELKMKCIKIKKIPDVKERYVVARDIVEKYSNDYITKEGWLEEIKEILYEKTNYETKKKRIKYFIREDGKVFFDEKIIKDISLITKKKSQTDSEYLKRWQTISNLIDYENVDEKNKYIVYKWIIEESGI